jgi:hypothetical protein
MISNDGLIQLLSGLRVEIVPSSVADISDRVADMRAAVHRFLLGEMAKHLDPEAAVEIAYDSVLPGPSDDLGRQAPRGARLAHDMVGELVSPRDELVVRQDLIHHAVFERGLRIDRLPGQQRVGSAFDAEQLLEAAMDAVARHGADVEMEIVDDRIVGTNRQVAHQADFRMEARPVKDADGGYLKIVDQRADIDPPVLIGVLISPVVEVLLFQSEAFGVGIHHELLSAAAEDQDFVLRIGADRLQHLPERAMILHAQLDRPAAGVSLDEDHAVFAPFNLVVIFEAFAVLIELWSRNELLKRHGHFFL